MKSLKKFKIVNADKISKLILGGIEYVLDSLTDADAKVLFESGSPYIEKIETSDPLKASTK